LTFGERHKRADIQKIVQDMDALESAFLTDAQKLNKKRQATLNKRVKGVVNELQKAYLENDKEEVEGILASLKMPSSKEWGKTVKRLVSSSAKAGVLRAHFEWLRLKELYEFSDIEVVSEGYDYEVIFPKEALDFIDKYSYEIGVITEETVIERIREHLRKGLKEGLTPKELTEHIMTVTDSWLSPAHAQTIARTETGKMYNAGRLARWLDPEANGFVEALQYDAIVDTRTTDLCRHLDGMIIAVSNGAMVAKFTPPNHYQCRATWLPVSKYEEWEDNFDTSVDPDKNFIFTAPTTSHKLIENKKEPLVQPKKKVNPATITDIQQIRNLPDDDFKIAIGNVKDQKEKLSLIKERAEQMVIRVEGLKEKRVAPQFMWYGFDSEALKGSFEIYDQLVEFYMTQETRGDIEELVRQLQGASDSEIAKALEAFEKKFAGSLAHMDMVRVIREVQKTAPVETSWEGLATAVMTAEATKQLTIKTPPQTKNFKSATGLQQAIKDGQKWLLKHLDSKLAPQTGVKLKFKHDLWRAYATGATGEIFFGKYEKDAGVIVHETAHVIHWNNPEVADLIHEWYEQRTAGEKMTKHNGEDTKRDHFYNPYVGRVYGWEAKYGKVQNKFTNTGFMGQEVLSMGMQAMYTDPIKFYKQDKEHFLLTYAIIKGLF
jgi:SPP1 gp7 family putative phage head morphogenesis protein